MHLVFIQVEGIALLTVQIVMLQVKWISWMTGVTMPTIPPEMNFSDIIIPTMDLVRGSFVLEMLLINNKKVRYISKDKRSLEQLLHTEYRVGLYYNRPFPNYFLPLFQGESWCSSFHTKISFHLYVNEN